MKKLQFFLFLAALISLASISITTVNASSLISSRTTNNTRTVSDLNMLVEAGFGWDGPRIATFDDSTNTIVYQNSVSWFNPGGNVYTKNELVGYKKDGSSVKLMEGDRVGSSSTGDLINYTYKLSETEKNDYTYYRVNLDFRDTLWGVTGSAQAQFTLN